MEHILNRRTATILAYTRIHKPGMTPCGLAYAVHFAISRDGRVYESLNQNYGILFAPADITENNTIDTKSLKNPYIFPLIEGGWGHRRNTHTGNRRARFQPPHIDMEDQGFHDLYAA